MLPNREQFLVKDPVFHPLSQDYASFWGEQLRRSVLGYWAGGVWMPPALYYYVNFHTIRLNKDEHTATKMFAQPHLRDLEWYFFRHYTEARGFSGFSQDQYNSCHRILLDPDISIETLKKKYPNTVTPDGNKKNYIPARSYMSTVFDEPMGEPLFENHLQNFMMLGSRDIGKALRNSSIVYTNSGTKQIGDLVAGDEIFGDDGKLTKVMKVYPQGKLQLYRLTFRDGRQVDACENHLWTLYKKDKLGTFKTKELISTYKSSRNKSYKNYNGVEYNYFLPTISPVEFEEQKLPVDPYTLGILIGDGSLTQAVTFTTADDEIIKYIPYEVKKLKAKYLYSINGLVPVIKELGLNVKSENKRIPAIYKRASVHQRLALLQGLMDTDGCVSSTGNIEFSTSSERLADDVLDLCRSLGYIAKCVSRKTARLDNYRIYIFTSSPIFKLERKLSRLKSKKTHSKVALVNIEKIDVDYSTCITVDNDSNLFLTDGYTPTHNSYSVSGLIAHNFIFSGAVSLTDLYNPQPTEILVGAEKSDKSGDILKKVRDALDLLPGKQTIYTGMGEKTYPAPFNKRYRGSWDVNKEVVAEYKKKTQGAWSATGSKTSIKHRSFNADAFAAQGTRPTLLVLEEVGMFSNLKDVYANTVDSLRRGLRKTGMLMMLGTGGDMEKGTLHASEMFYEPEKYDLLAFEDVWEGRGKIGYFVPAYLALDDHKDDNGESDIESAKQELVKVRKRKQGNGTSSDALNKEMQYRPLVPSEMFLSKSANIFPTAELRRRLSEVQTHKIYDHTEKRVNLYFDSKSQYNGVNYEIDPRLEAITVFPYDGDSREGAVVIYEFPKLIDDKVPDGAYIIGCDPFKDDSQTGQSLASIYVMKTSKYPSTIGYDEIVASYVGRPYLGKNQVNETLHKLSMFYGNAKIYFENAVGNVKDYFEKVRRLELLARQPVTVFNKKASYDTGPQVIYGYPMSNQKIKWEALQYLRMWLLEEREEDKRNLDLIIDPALLQELISFTMDGNFDRVMSLVGCIVGLEEIRNLSKRRLQSEQETSAIQEEFKRLIVNNKNLFHAKFSQTTSVLL